MTDLDQAPGASPRDVELRSAVAEIRRHWRRRRVIEGIPVVVAAAIVALLIGLGFRAALSSAATIIVATRVVGYLLLAIAVVRWMIVPAFRRPTDEQVALYIEEQAPDLRQLFLSAVYQLHEGSEAGKSPALAARVIDRAIAAVDQLERGAAIERPRARRAVARFAALAAAGALLVVAGPTTVREIAKILFVPWSRAAAAAIPALSVAPGNISIPRGAALDVRAAVRSLPDVQAELVVRTDSSDQWTRIAMVRDSTSIGFVARLFDINRNTIYYVDAGSLRSPQYHITVTDLPTVKELDVELHYPAYTGLPVQKISDGGDVVAVTGTSALVRITPTLPVTGGSLHFDDGSTVPLIRGADGGLAGSFRIAHDGFYRVDLVAANGTLVPGTVQHSVEALVDHPPTVRIDKPGHDTRVMSVDEVPISIRASDDYGVKGVELHYAVNGGADHVVPLSDSTHHGSIDFNAVHTVMLEDLSLHVGDLVAYHATARDGAGNAASSDIYFMEVRPYGLDYQSADANAGGGGGGGRGGANPGQFTVRQRQIISGTFNWQRDSARTGDRDRRANATTLAIAQGKLMTDVATQAAQISERGVRGEDTLFVLVQAELDSAATAMKPAEDGLGRHAMGDAIPAQEKALQHLQAADDAYRTITIQRGSGGGGGGGGGGSQDPKDLADLFELQTDKLKNQYETPRTQPSTDAQQAIDSVQQKLQELAARQEQENERQQRAADELSRRAGAQNGNSGRGQQGGAQRGGQQGQSGGQQGGQQGAQGAQGRGGGSGGGQQGQSGGQQPGAQGGSSGQQGQQLIRPPTAASGGAMGSSQRELARQVEEQARQLEKLSRDQNSPELADAARRMQEAADAMRQAASGSTPQGAAALDRLRDAARNLSGAQTSAEGQGIQDLARRANALGAEQQQIASSVAGLPSAPSPQRDQQMNALDQRKDALANAVSQLGLDARKQALQSRRDQPKAAAAAQSAADEITNRQLSDLIGYSKGVMRDNAADRSREVEREIGETLDSVAHRLAAASGSVSTPRDQLQSMALDRAHDLVSGLESLRNRTTGAQGDQLPGEQGDQQQGSRDGQSGNRGEQQRGQQGGQPGQQRAQQGGQRGSQGGQQGAQPGGQRGSQPGGEQGSQQGGQQGQQGQQGSQPGGQQGSQQGGQQGGQGGQQAGQASGQNSGSGGGNGAPNNLARGRGATGSFGDIRQFRGEVAVRAQDAEALRKQLSQQGVDVAPLDRAIGQLHRLQEQTNPGRADELQASIIAGLKDFEFNVWRKFNGDAGNTPALGSMAQVPPEYRAMVEEYYRSLARKGPN